MAGCFQFVHGQKKRAVESCACPVDIDSSFKTNCGYLIVPENRKKNNSKTIKLPFIVVYSKNSAKKKDPLLYTTGGPGGSSLGWARGAPNRSVTRDRDCIAFEQRGTRFAIPKLESGELSEAIKESYRRNLPKDSMMVEGVKRFKKAFEEKGIDLSGYNTDETVSDIDDLLVTLGIDSVNLTGGSYSGGLMLAVLQKDPARVRSLILDSPLPTFVPIDEDEPANFNEALNTLFNYCKKDSINQELYGNLKQKFQDYFSSIEGKIFTINYLEKGSLDSISIQYTRNDLLNVIENTITDFPRIKDVPFVITQLINGNHRSYIQEILDGIFSGGSPTGMRISVYCADQTAYHNETILQQLPNAYPWMKGYHINDVYKSMCDCWKVPPIKKETKTAFYSDKPVLLADGALDPACRPLYIDMLAHYMPNAQRIIYLKRSHMVLGGKEASEMMQSFIDNPYRKVATDNKEIIVY